MMLQLAFILFCVMAIPMSILTWYSGSQILHNSESAIAESSLAGLNANRRLNENALNNLAQDTARLAVTNVFDRIRDYSTYTQLNANYGNISNALALLHELQSLKKRIDGVYSTYFYLSDSNYVISTDRGITMLDRYESIDWIERALAGRRGISGVWYPRRLASGTPVVSYVLPLSRLSTTTRGTIVVNLQESQIGNYLRSSEPGGNGYMLMESDGTLISHNDKALLHSNGGKLPFIKDILGGGVTEGYAFHELEGERLLYTWSDSTRYGWMNVSISSMDALMTKTHAMQRNIILLTAIIIFAGAILTVFLATWLSKPLRRLVRTLRERGNLEVSEKNELAFLGAAFQRMQEEEESLYKLLHEREQDTRSLAIHNLLRGEVSEQIAEMFPEPYFLVAVVSIDRYRRYVSSRNPETRSYHRYLLISKCESLFPQGIHARCVYQGEGCFIIVINYGFDEHERDCDGIRNALYSVRNQALELLGHSVTIGISSRADSGSMIDDRLAEAMEVIKHRMIEGFGGITFWKQEIEQSIKYVYPANSERRILNFLDIGDLDSIKKEMEVIRGEIRSVEYISYDNILFIYNQLAGATIRHLRENNVRTERIFAGRSNIYSAIASMDTLDELEEYLREFFGEIVQYQARKTGEATYGERIIRHLEQHYGEEIAFEDMAKEIGISYSYMRKILYEQTGKSLIDYLNQLRIEKAKQLLLDTDQTIAQIALQVGYNNVQSFNRFFRKYEGMPPSNYKTSKT